MRVGVFSAKRYDRESLLEANARSPVSHELVFLEARLSKETASIGATHPVVCAFVNDRIDAAYRAKYARSPYVGPMVAPEARAATLKLIPS